MVLTQTQLRCEFDWLNLSRSFNEKETVQKMLRRMCHLVDNSVQKGQPGITAVADLFQTVKFDFGLTNWKAQLASQKKCPLLEFNPQHSTKVKYPGNMGAGFDGSVSFVFKIT